MAHSGIETPKPLLMIGGRTLLEHNVAALLASSVDRIYISVRGSAGAIRELIDTACASMARSAGVSLEPLVEDEPLGNVGALGRLPDSVDLTIISFADNLTALRPPLLVEHHRRTGAALTLAAHRHTFVMPFGELVVNGSAVTSYTEKPSTRPLVASALTVASRRAMDIARRGTPLGLVDLTNALLAAGEPVEAFRHETPWIDINDRAAIKAAETLIEEHREAFRWFVDGDGSRG